MVQVAGVVDLVTIAALFALAVVVSYPRPRTWMVALGAEFVSRFGRPEHPPAWELENAELWLMTRREQLTENLRRIEFLLLHDQAMSATRQLGNRLARDQLVASLALIPDRPPGQDRRFAHPTAFAPMPDDIAAPTPTTATRRPVVEVLEVGGWR